jgi:serine protease Do
VVTGQNIRSAGVQQPAGTMGGNAPVGVVNEIRWLGMELKPIAADVVAKFPMLAGKQGSLVKDVKTATVAENAGVMKGDVVLKINNAPVTSAGELDLAVAQANVRSGVLLLVERNGTQRYLTLQ